MSIQTSLDAVPFNGFDVVVVLVLAAGIAAGRKRGMSEELMSLLTWLAILVGCSQLYEWGGEMLAGFTTLFGRLTCYILAYVGGAMLIMLLFAGIKRGLGGKLVGSDIFGRAEYYLGMGAGLVRFSCVLLVGLALLNARYFNPLEVRAMEKFQDDVYGSNFFPTLHSLQTTVFERSPTGSWIKKNLSTLLIKPTEPDRREMHQRDAGLP